MVARPIPEGYHSVTPYLIVDRAEEAIRFYERAFGANEMLRLPMGGKIGHAEVKIGDSMVMLSDEWPDYGKLGPTSRGGATSSLMIYLEDVDAAFDRAVAAGATVERPVEDQFYGDRSGTVIDPFGHSWTSRPMSRMWPTTRCSGGWLNFRRWRRLSLPDHQKNRPERIPAGL